MRWMLVGFKCRADPPRRSSVGRTRMRIRAVPIAEYLWRARHYASSLFTLFNPYNKFLREVLLLLANEKTNAQQCGAKVQPTFV